MASEKIRLFINGFGRIGRCAARILMNDPRFELVGINDIYSFEQMQMLFRYDSVYGTLPHEVSLQGDRMIVAGQPVTLCRESDPGKLMLEKIGVDVVLECSGYFLTLPSCQPFLQQGARRVVVSTPPKDEMPVYIRGVNDSRYAAEPVISASSCSANAIVPVFSIIEDAFGIESAMLSMYHSYTSYQRLLDTKHYSHDTRRARSATQNIIPLQSSAAGATAYFFPHLRDKLYAKSIRIPLDAVTFYDLTIRTGSDVTQKGIRAALHEAVSQRYRDILALSHAPKVSSDYIADPHSAVIDLPLCSVQERDLIRICAWQDNEYGYASRLVDMAAVVAER